MRVEGSEAGSRVEGSCFEKLSVLIAKVLRTRGSSPRTSAISRAHRWDS